MYLDPDTLQLTSAASRAAYFVVFLIMALRQPRETCLWHWIGAILTSLIGSALLARVPQERWLYPSEGLTIYVFFLASLTLSWSGLRSFNGQIVRIRTIGLLTVLPGSLYAGAVLTGVPMRAALSTVFAFCTLYSLGAAREAWREPSGPRLWSRVLVSPTFGLYAAAFALTLVVLITTDEPMNTSSSSTIVMMVDQAASVLIYFGCIAMVGERAVLTIQGLAETDPLTGLSNRRGLDIALRRSGRALRATDAAGVLLADIDHFKQINDRLGHEAGDAVLAAFAGRLRNACRSGDIVARWGGEEFIVVLPGTDLSHLATVADHLRRAVEADPFSLPGGGTVAVTVSIGITDMPPELSAFGPATRRADEALYEAKSTGRNKVYGRPRAAGPAVVVDCAA